MNNVNEIMNTMKKNTHCYEVLKYLNNVGKNGITSMEAFQNLGVTRLSAVIYDLKNKFGVPINSENVSYIARNGRHVTFSRYYLVA